MNKVASRALIVMVLVLALLGGTVFFVVDYVMHGDSWVMKPGSPHVYQNNRVSQGVVTDSEGTLLLSMVDKRTYSSSRAIRASTVHWLGDRQGNIPGTMVSNYASQLVGFDLVGGTYQYGDAVGQMTLTLNAQVQAAALEALGDRVGTVAVYNYETGQLICAVTSPNYDPDNVPDIAGDTTGTYEGVYVNRFLRSKYIPGSIFKIVTLAAALESLPDVQDQTFTCTGRVEYGVDAVTCEQAHGTQSLKDAFCNSCNCAFGELTIQIGKERMQQYVQQFGLLDSVSFDGVSSVAGNFRVEDAAQQELAWSGIGQFTDQINPCSFLRFVGAIANGGIATQPYVVESVQAGGTTTYQATTQSGQRMLSAATAKVLREYMANNVTSKYGASNFPGLSVCAKSGTGEVGGEKRPNAMFTGFLTDSGLPLAFIACVEDGGYGASTCMPILSKVLTACSKVHKN